MSGIKRNFLAEECSATTNDNNIQPSSPIDSPQSKKLRRASSHHTTESENDDDDDDETQEDQYEQENGITNGTKNLEEFFFNKLHLFSLRSFTSTIRKI
jgi:hypothetical protein